MKGRKYEYKTKLEFLLREKEYEKYYQKFHLVYILFPVESTWRGLHWSPFVSISHLSLCNSCILFRGGERWKLETGDQVLANELHRQLAHIHHLLPTHINCIKNCPIFNVSWKGGCILCAWLSSSSPPPIFRITAKLLLFQIQNRRRGWI